MQQTSGRFSSRLMAQAMITKRRNFGIVAHVDAGKTTVSERVLFLTGTTHKLGEVHDGEATMDYLEEERKRGITITAAAAYGYWNDHTLSLIDTPGHIDFTIEVERSLRVLDGCVTVFCSVGGVEPQSETVWRQAERYNVPRIAFINKMDRPGADFDAALEEMRKKLHARPVPIGLPVGTLNDFKSVINVVDEQLWTFTTKDDGKIVVTKTPVPAEHRERLETARLNLFEALADFDETIMGAFLDGNMKDVPLSLLKKALRKATIAREHRVTPVLCGAALRNVGVHLLLDAVVDYLPAPEDHPPVEGHDPKTGEELLRARSQNAPTVGLAFKTISEPTGDLTFVRLYSGSVDSDSQLLNARTGNTHRMGRILRMLANKRESVERAVAGDIIAVLGLKDVLTGDTLCDPRHPIELEAPAFPEPVMTCAISVAKSAERDKLAKALSRLLREDPSLRRITDEQTGETLLGGMGELHLEICTNRLRNDFGVDVIVGAPQVAYRQTLAKGGTIEARHIKQSGGSGQYAVAKFIFEVVPEVDGLEFIDETKGGSVPKEYHGSLERGLKEEMANGGDLRFPIVGVRARLVDGKHHEVDSSDNAFQACGRLALRMAMDAFGMTLLEPILKLAVIVPESHQGIVIGDLANRRAKIAQFENTKGFSRITGTVPAATMFAYNTRLLSMTAGSGQFSLEPHAFEKVPDAIALTVREERKKQLAAKAALKA